MAPNCDGPLPRRTPLAGVDVAGMDPHRRDPQARRKVLWPAVVSDKQGASRQQSNKVGKFERSREAGHSTAMSHSSKNLDRGLLASGYADERDMHIVFFNEQVDQLCEIGCGPTLDFIASGGINANERPIQSLKC